MSVVHRTHFLKSWTVHFEAGLDGRKPWEARIDDRGFQQGDAVVLCEWNPSTKAFTGRSSSGLIGYLFRGQYGFPSDWVVFTVDALTPCQRMLPEQMGTLYVACLRAE